MSTTPIITRIERERAVQQVRLDGEKSQVERNRLGQFATPPELARAMARLALKYWPSSKRVRFLDPGVGTGAFYSALRAEFPKRQIEDAVGIELDSAVAAVTRKLWGTDGLAVRRGDFTKLSAPPAGERANLILANPPYVRHHHLVAEDKLRLQRRVAQELGLGISGLAGLYCYFLLLCDRWMADKGIAAWLIPSEFFDVNYGRVLREYLTQRVTLLRVHRFDPSKVQFDDALVSSVVLLFRKATPGHDHRVEFTVGGSLEEPERTREVQIGALGASDRWTAFLNGHEDQLTTGPRLGDFFKIKRGIATGANGFFIIPRQRAIELRLPQEFLRPILPSPRMLPDTVVESERDGYPRIPEQLALLDCSLPEAEIKKRWPALRDYLQAGAASGLLARYLVSKRQPWYAQEQRPPAPFLCTYMGRGTGETKPFRFIWNKSQATAANVYLLLYPTGALKEALRTKPQVASQVFDFLNSIGAEMLRSGGRVYGGALHKVEPKELGNLPALALAEMVGPEAMVETQLPLFAGHVIAQKSRAIKTA